MINNFVEDQMFISLVIYLGKDGFCDYIGSVFFRVPIGKLNFIDTRV